MIIHLEKYVDPAVLVNLWVNISTTYVRLPVEEKNICIQMMSWIIWGTCVPLRTSFLHSALTKSMEILAQYFTSITKSYVRVVRLFSSKN